MKFSVLIPTLNEEKYIGQLLHSLTLQTFKDFEVIICDGQSTDKTVAVSSKFKSKLKLKIFQADHRGAAYQRNLAARTATTDHFIFFDADTQPDPEFLEAISQAIDAHGFQVATAWLNPMSDNLFDKIIFGSFNIFYQETVKKFAPVATGVFIYVSKLAFETVGGFNENIKVAEDFDLVSRLHQAKYKFELLRKPAIPYSVRRLDKDGRLHYLTNVLKSGYYYHLHGTNHNRFRTSKWYNFGKFK